MACSWALGFYCINLGFECLIWLWAVGITFVTWAYTTALSYCIVLGLALSSFNGCWVTTLHYMMARGGDRVRFLKRKTEHDISLFWLKQKKG